jgi:hypothetical protein
MPEDDERDETGADEDAGTGTDDTEGQVLTWKVRKPIPDVEEDAEGHAGRPPHEVVDPPGPWIEEDDTEGHGGMSGNPRPPVD